MQSSDKGEKLESIKKTTELKTLEFKQVKELLIKSWMTHDGMWFYHCAKEFGIDKTNKINKAAVKSMAKIEMQRIKNAIGIKEVKSFEAFKNLMKIVFSVVKADFMDFTFECPSKNILIFTMNNCFAFDGIKRMGYLERYSCGIFQRLKGWFEELGIQYDIIPQINGCMMKDEGICYRKFQFFFTSD
ncbi:MAG: DUF6125 family protein [Candidatus Hermodarchaeota archaeon]